LRISPYGVNQPGLLQTILGDHWQALKPKLVRKLPAEVATAAQVAVEKTLRCRTEDNGFARYRCQDCGKTHTLCFSCKSRFCPQCGKARAAQAATNASARLLNVWHRHLTFTVPPELREMLFWNRSLLSVVANAAARATLEAVGTRCRAHPPLPGIMATVHTYGRDLGWHVHVHVLCTEGGLRADGVWQPVKYFPATQYRRLWQQHLLSALRNKLKHQRGLKRQIGALYPKYPRGFIVNVMSRYFNGRQAAAYCCRYTGRPPLSEKRITAYDGKQVTLSYTDYRDGQEKRLVLSAKAFLLRLLQHVWPRYQRDVHYYGLYQPARRKAHTQAVVSASRYGEQVLPRPALSRWERLWQRLSQPQFACPYCGGTLFLENVFVGSYAHAPPKTQTVAKDNVQLSLCL
jgi:hypothetical protein